jgi:spermidine synthase
MASLSEHVRKAPPRRSFLRISEARGLPHAALFSLGATSIVTQIVLLREFLSVFYGNELVIGVVLANWMLLTGLGSFLGKRAGRFAAQITAVILCLLALAILPPITVALVRILRNMVFVAGSMIGIMQALSGSLILLTPYCLVSGFSFALFSAALAHRQKGNPVSSSYAAESLGSATGGAIFSLVVLPLFNAFAALAILLTLNCCLALLVAYLSRSRKFFALSAALLCIAALVMGFGRPDAFTRRFLFPGQELVSYKDTPYGNLTVTRQSGQMNFFENNVLLFSTGEISAVEENVHYAMVQHPLPRHVLLIGGGISGLTREILKYNVDSIDYTEVNPWIIDLGRKYTTALDDPRIRIINDDARRFIRRSSSRYDVALISLPDPETAYINRYYTVEFFQELKNVLNSNGVVSTSLLPGVEYQGPEATQLSSSLYATLRSVFANVLIVPGGRNFFLASDGPLDIHIARLIEERGIDTVYVNQFYLDDRMLAERSNELTANLKQSAVLNTDLVPVCYFQQLSYWLSSFGTSAGPWALFLIAAGLMLLWRFHVVGAAVFVAGLSASSIEMILLLGFQTLYGSLYRMTGIVITAFMAGLAAGAWAIRRFDPKASLKGLAGLKSAVAGISFLLPFLLPWLQKADLAPIAVHLVFTALAFATAVIIGMEFGFAASIRAGDAASVAGELYGIDLAGSAVGALVVTVYAIPLLGIKNVSILIGIICMLVAVLCLGTAEKYRVRASYGSTP